MSVAIEQVVALIEQAAPPSLAYEWDNTGLLIRCSDTVSQVLITLDVTYDVVDEAIETGCDMILSHHPVMLRPIQTLHCGDASQGLIMRMVQSGISLYAAHTSFDRAAGGINDALANRLDLQGIKTIGGDGEDMMRTGLLKAPLDTAQLICHIKNRLGIKYLKTSKPTCDTIAKLAVAGGSGGSFIGAAKRAGADALVTGEAKYHHFLEAHAACVLLIEAGHFDTEVMFVDEIFLSLQSRLNEVQLALGLKIAKSVQVPYEYHG